jgi:DNA-binding NtrC family response regulator
MPGTLLLVDDNENNVASLQIGFGKSGYEVLTANGGTAAVEVIGSRPVDVVVTDLRMPDLDGMGVLQAALQAKPSPQVIILTAFGTVESAVEALQKGAFTYLTKPVNLNELRAQVAKAMEVQDLKRENIELRKQIDRRYGFEEMIGETREMQQMVERVRAIADTRATVLIEGESGTGKELVARALHRNSSRANKAFIPIHCAALSESLIESELFGHEKGSFTGASQQRRGLFELAEGGTVFLDEVGEIPLGTQVKLLRVLESREFLRVGGAEPVKVDVRVLAATNRVLAEEVEEGRFREDLYYRLNVVRIVIPPLRARAADIPLLARTFLSHFAQEHNKPPLELSKKALAKLMQYHWPGNVRQLRNAIENLVLFSRGGEIDVDDLPADLLSGQSEDISVAVGVPLDQVERKLIERTLVFTNGNRTRAAELLGISRRTLLRKLKELNMES